MTPSSVLSSSQWLCLPTPFLGSPWRVTAPQHPQASVGRSASALPTSRPCPGCRAYWRQEAQEEAREETAVPAGYLSAIHFIPRLLAREGAWLWRSEAGCSSGAPSPGPPRPLLCAFMELHSGGELLPAPPLLSSLPTVPGPCTLPTAPPWPGLPSSGWPTEGGTRGIPHSLHHRVMEH